MLELVALISFGCLIVVWILYPGVMAALAARRRAPSVVMSRAEPTVSIVLATRDDEAAVQRRIADCARCDYDPAKLEIVVALDRRCATAAAPSSFAQRCTSSGAVRCTGVLGDEPGGKAATLNAAVRACRGEILVFVDTYQRFQRDAIRHLVSSLEDARVGASAGSLSLPRSSGAWSLAERYWEFERWLRRCEAQVHSSVGVSGAIWSLRKSLWAPLPAHLILDDVYTPMRVVLRGYRVAFAESARALETRRPGPAQEYRRKVRSLTGVIQLCGWLPAALLPVRNPIWLQFIFHKLLRLLTPYWMLAIVIWAGAVGARWLVAKPFTAVGVVVAALVAAAYARGRLAFVIQRARDVVVWGLMLQAAVVTATLNGIRRRWDVWRV